VFKPGTHGSTFGGNPLACAAAMTTLEVVERDGLMANAVRQGNAIRAGFHAELAGVAGVVDIRGVGLMIGIELDRPCGALVALALEAGLLINVTADTTIRLVPSLVYSDADSQELVRRLAPIIRNFLAGEQLAA
jgi:acetylornithine aminotransferase